MGKATTKATSKKKAMTKSAFVGEVAEKTGLTKKQIEAVLHQMVETIKHQLGAKGPGKLVLPGLARLSLSQVKAVKGGEKKINPLTKTEYITKDRPAYNKVRINPIKALKEALK
jgi:nucleoid DNA-binding protein